MKLHVMGAKFGIHWNNTIVPHESIDWHWIGVGCQWWMTLESCWLQHLLGRRKHPLDVGEPKIEQKWQSSCATANFVFYALSPKKQCLNA